MPHRRHQLESWAVAVVFAFAIGIVILDHFALDVDPSEPVNENRYLAAMPSILEATSLRTFREDFERYHRDHMGLRDSLIRGHSLTAIRLLRQSRLTAGEMTVYVGEEGWLYFGYALRDYMGTEVLTTGQLAWWTAALRDRTVRLEEEDVAYAFFTAPSKADVYPEHLPAHVRRGSRPMALDLLIERVSSEHADIALIDLRPALRDAKAWHEVYWRTDHHWNAPGAFAAVSAVVSYITRWFPNEGSPPMEKLTCTESPETGGMSLARGLGLTGYYQETDHRLQHPSWDLDAVERSRDETTGDLIYTNEANPDGLRLVCIGDSYTFDLLPFYARQFARVRFVGRWPPDYDHDALVELARAEQADLVLEERTAWALLEVPGIAE